MKSCKIFNNYLLKEKRRLEYNNFQKVKRLKIKDLSEYSVITDIRILTITLLRKKEIKYCKQRLVQSQRFIILQKKDQIAAREVFCIHRYRSNYAKNSIN